jgi:hypothetical protein
MSSATAPQVSLCPEYQHLLEQCQKALVAWQQHRTLIARAPMAGRDVAANLKRLQTSYTLAYAQLESHEHSCRICQYIAKIAGLDFESLADALNRYQH